MSTAHNTQAEIRRRLGYLDDVLPHLGLWLWFGIDEKLEQAVVCVRPGRITDGFGPQSSDDHLLVLSVDDDDLSLKVQQHRTPELTARTRGKPVSLDWLERFLYHAAALTPVRHTGESPIHESRKLSDDTRFYVYTHRFRNGSLYIGKGNKCRSTEFTSGRSTLYLSILEEFGEPSVETIAANLTEAAAYTLESKLIREHRSSGQKLLNRTDGAELAPIGDLPGRTLSVLAPQITDAELLQVVRLAKGKPSNVASTIIGLTLVDAAIRIGCTPNELLALTRGHSSTVEGWRPMELDEAIRLHPKDESDLRSGKPFRASSE